VTYSNLFLATAISSPDHPFWQWLANRSGRVAGLSLEIRLEVLEVDSTEVEEFFTDDDDLDEEATVKIDQLPNWIQPLQILSGIPGAQLRVKCLGRVNHLDHPCITQWLKQHGQLISHLTVEVYVSEVWLKLRDFCEAAAPCNSIDLQIIRRRSEVIDLADLDPVSSSLHRLTFHPISWELPGNLRGASALNSMSQLRALYLGSADFGSEEPWSVLASLRSLRELHLKVRATGDPSPLSALTSLTSLYLRSLEREADLDDPAAGPFSFSSLQPLSTLLQLHELHLGNHACAATSLQGLAGLSNLQTFQLEFNEAADYGGRLRSLEGISPGVREISLAKPGVLVSLAGIESCTTLETLSLRKWHVPSLHSLRGLSSLKRLQVSGCCVDSLEGLHSMSLQILTLSFCSSVMSLEGLYCMSLQCLRVSFCHSLITLSGVEHLPALESLVVEHCGVTSLQPLSQLGKGLQELKVHGCNRVQDEILELPHVQPTANVSVRWSNVREVVLAGGVRRAVGRPPLRL
jgi:Leucine-rich repeat (LRR) protein